MMRTVDVTRSAVSTWNYGGTLGPKAEDSKPLENGSFELL